MATDYVTSPITPLGQIVFGIILGLLTGIFRIFGANAEGVSYAIIFSNLLVPLIERFTVPTAFGKAGMKNKILHDAVILTVITIVAGFLLGLVHDVTLKPIADATFKKQQAAYRNVFKDADSFEEYADFDADAATQAAADAGFVNDLVEGAGRVRQSAWLRDYRYFHRRQPGEHYIVYGRYHGRRVKRI